VSYISSISGHSLEWSVGHIEIDGILRAQAQDNLSCLRVLYAQDIVRRALFALLALHLQKSIRRLRILADFSVKADGFIVLRTLSVVLK
jgi:hypothetical protein